VSNLRQLGKIRQPAFLPTTVTSFNVSGQTNVQWNEVVRNVNGPRPPGARRRRGRGFTLIELLCVIAIIAILLSLLLPTLFRAYRRVRDMADEQEAPEVAYLLRKESRNYCGANPQFRFDSKADFVDKCKFIPKCRAWVEAASTDFIAFDYLAPTNKIVLSVHIGRRHATTYSFSKADLSERPDR